MHGSKQCMSPRMSSGPGCSRQMGRRQCAASWPLRTAAASRGGEHGWANAEQGRTVPGRHPACRAAPRAAWAWASQHTANARHPNEPAAARSQDQPPPTVHPQSAPPARPPACPPPLGWRADATRRAARAPPTSPRAAQHPAPPSVVPALQLPQFPAPAPGSSTPTPNPTPHTPPLRVPPAGGAVIVPLHPILPPFSATRMDHGSKDHADAWRRHCLPATASRRSAQNIRRHPPRVYIQPCARERGRARRSTKWRDARRQPSAGAGAASRRRAVCPRAA